MIKPAQETILPTTATRLDETMGKVRTDRLEGFGLDPDRRMNIVMLAGQMGTKLAESFDQTDFSRDQALGVDVDDFSHAFPANLVRTLYYPRGDKRRREEPRPAMLVTVPEGTPTLNLPGVVGRYDSIVVGGEDFRIIARDPHRISDTIQANVEKAHEDDTDRDYKNQRTATIVVEAMTRKQAALASLDTSVESKRDVLYRINRDARIVWRTSYLGKNLDRDRQRADEIIHAIAEIACINLNLGTKQESALHRGITSNLYRRGSSRDLSTAWKSYTRLFGLYLNAERGKISQSQNACQYELERRLAFLPEAA